MKIKIFWICFVFFLAIQRGETKDRWRFTILPESAIYSLTPDRNHPNLIFAAAVSEQHESWGGLYKSTDYGRTWHLTSLESDVRQVVVHPATSEVWVVTEGEDVKLWHSNDQGSTFRVRETLQHPEFGKLVLNPFHPNILYRAFSKGEISKDGGRSWSRLRFSPNLNECELKVDDLLVSPLREDTLYTSVEILSSRCSGLKRNTTYLLETSTSGKSWKVLLDLGYNYPALFETDAAFPDRAFLLTVFNGLFRLDATGWIPISSHPLSQLASVPHHPEELWGIENVTGYIGGVLLLHSTDSGQSWQSDPDNLAGTIGLVKVLEDENMGLLAGTGTGVWHRNTSRTWHLQNTGLKRRNTESVSLVAAAGSRAYAISYDRILYRKLHPSAPWKTLVHKYGLSPAESIFSIMANPLNSNHVLMLGVGYSQDLDSFYPLMLVSKNGGDYWQRSTITTFCSGDENLISTFDPFESSTLYASCNGSLFKSRDFGLTFEQISSRELYYVSQILVDNSDTNIVYVVSHGRILKSADGGKTFKTLKSGPNLNAEKMAALPQKNGYLMITAYGKVFQTFDGGESWQVLSTVNLDPYGDYCDHVYYCSPRELQAPDSRHYFLITNAGLFFESIDAGKSWESINGKMDSVWDMTASSKRPFYVASSSGVFLENR